MIVYGACISEDETERLPGGKISRIEKIAVIRGDGVRNGIVINPSHFCASFDGQG